MLRGSPAGRSAGGSAGRPVEGLLESDRSWKNILGAAGGITDLSFCGIRLELRAENEQFVSEETATQYIQQTAQYVAGSDRRFGALAIFDGSPKSDAPGLVANDIFPRLFAPQRKGHAHPHRRSHHPWKSGKAQ
jgi:hypothetical protein